MLVKWATSPIPTSSSCTYGYVGMPYKLAAAESFMKTESLYVETSFNNADATDDLTKSFSFIFFGELNFHSGKNNFGSFRFFPLSRVLGFYLNRSDTLPQTVIPQQ